MRLALRRRKYDVMGDWAMMQAGDGSEFEIRKNQQEALASSARARQAKATAAHRRRAHTRNRD